MNATTNSKSIEIDTLRDRDHKFHGRNIPGDVSEGHRVEIVVGESITLHGREMHRRARPTLYANVFRIGDVAAVGGYNLTYTGIVRAITAKTVTVVEYEGTCNEKTYKLSVFRFDRLNWDFDAHETAKRNSEWMD